MSQTAAATPGSTPTLGSAQDPIESVLGGGMTTGATAGDSSGGSGTVGNLGQYLQLVGLLSKVLGGGGGGQQQMPAPMPIPHQAPQLSPPPIPPMGNITPPQAAILQRLLLGGGGGM